MKTVDKLSQDLDCKEEETEDGVYMVCKDKNGKEVYRKKLITV